MVSRNIIQILSDDIKSSLLPAKYTTDMLQLHIVADKQHMDALLSDKITQKYQSYIPYQWCLFYHCDVIFPFNSGGTNLPATITFSFFNNGTSAGRLWRDCNTEVILVCWSCSSLAEISEPLTKPAKHHS